MRDNTTEPRDAHGARDARDPNHIWLRQSVTFSVNGQTRTLELALPLRPGATSDEVDALLDEADAGMRRLSQRLDAHLAEVTGAVSTAPAASRPPAAPAASSAPAAATTPPASPRQPQPPAPAAPQPTVAERPEPPAEPPATRAPAVSAPPAPPAAPASGGPDLTRAEFLTAVTALDLDARTVMERLNVRSLNGLNLREALDLLRRQVLREGGASADPQPAPATPAATPAAMPAAMPAATPASMPAPIGHAHFDEEDDEGAAIDFELSYPDPDDLPGEDDDIADSADESFAPYEAPRDIAEATGPLSDVPDLDDLLAPAPPAAAASAVAPATPAADADAYTREVIATLRTAHPGGQPTAQQRMAYRNIVVDQLGEAKANSVARAIWSLTPDKLGPEQYDALIRWGKQDTFAEEVEDALTLLRAEWLAQQAAQQAAAQPGSPAKPTAPSRRPAPSAEAPAQTPTPPARPAPRGRPAASRANADAQRNGAGPQGGA